ncbi:MAG: ABC transporter permease [Holophagaceae bacterium]
MRSTGAFFAAERIKWRRSWPLVIALLAPLCQAGFLAIIFWFSENRVRMFQPGFQFWLELNFVVWNLMVLPVMTALLCELSWEQEREARAWNLLLVQPVPRHTHFLVKGLGHFTLVFLSQCVLALALPLLGFLFRSKPDLGMGPLPLVLLLQFLMYSILASIGPVAFHTWLSMRIPGIWMALAVAVAGTWLAFRLVGASSLVQALPWGLAAHMSIVFERWRDLPWTQVPMGLLLGGGLLALGTFDFTRHRETRS